MRRKIEKVMFLGVAPTFLGVLSYGICRHFFMILGEFKILSVLLLSGMTIAFLSYYAMGKRKRVLFPGVMLILLGVLSYGICKYLFLDIKGFKILSVLLLSGMTIALFSYLFKRNFGYLDHDFLFFISIDFLLLAIVDLFTAMEKIVGSESLVLYVFNKIAPYRNIENIRCLLSATCQSLAAIFAIVFSLTFIAAQLYVHLYEPAQARYIFKKSSTLFLILSYTIFILYNLLLLKIILPDSSANSEYLLQQEKFIVLSLVSALFCFFLLIPYLMSIITELDPDMMTRIMLDEAYGEIDKNKLETVKRIASNMKHWYRSGRKSQFVDSWFELDGFLTKIVDETGDKTLRDIKSVINNLHESVVKQDHELGILIMDQHVKRAKEVIE